MTARTPTRVSLYAYAASEEQPVAQFRWSPESGVTLTVSDPAWSQLAEEYLALGVPSGPAGPNVPASDGEAFMRALVEPRQLTYYAFLDESPEQDPPEEPAGDGDGYSV